MAGFIEIRDRINREIKENGQGEITGTVLNGVLDAMIDAVDQVKIDTKRVYQFLGFELFSEDEHYLQDAVVVYDGGLFVFNNEHEGPWDFSDVSVTNLVEFIDR